MKCLALRERKQPSKKKDDNAAKSAHEVEVYDEEQKKKASVVGSVNDEVSGTKWPRCGKLHDFQLEIDERLADIEETVYFIADSAEQLCHLNPSLLPGLLRLQQTTTRNVCFVLISEGFSGSIHDVTRGVDLVRVEFSIYSPLELQKILSKHVPRACIRQLEAASVSSISAIALYQNFAKQVVVELFHSSARDVREMMYIADELWPQYIAPVLRGDLACTNTRALYSAILPWTRRMQRFLYHHDVDWKTAREKGSVSPSAPALQSPSGDDNARVVGRAAAERAEKETDMFEKRESLRVIREKNLPFHSKLLVISAYLASYNPVDHDRILFSSRKNKRKRKRRSRSAQRGEHEVRSPKTFELERLL